MTTCRELHYLELTWAARSYKSTWNRVEDGDPKLIADHKRECPICSAPIPVELEKESGKVGKRNVYRRQLEDLVLDRLEEEPFGYTRRDASIVIRQSKNGKFTIKSTGYEAAFDTAEEAIRYYLNREYLLEKEQVMA